MERGWNSNNKGGPPAKKSYDVRVLIFANRLLNYVQELGGVGQGVMKLAENLRVLRASYPDVWKGLFEDTPEE